MSETHAQPVLDPRTRQWRVRVFTATWLSYFGFYFCRKPFSIAKAALEDDLGFDPSMLAAIGTCYLLAYTAGQFASGWLGSRWGPRVVLIGGMAISAATHIAFGLANSWLTFAAFMTVNGLAQSTGWANNVGTMANWFRRRERGTVMGLWATNFQLGGVAANALAAWMLGMAGVRWSFFAGSVVLLAVLLYFVLNQRDRPEDLGLPPLEDAAADDDDGAQTSDGGGRQGSGWTRTVWANVLIVGAFYFFVKFVRYAIWSWAPYLLGTRYGLALDDAGYVSTIFDVAGFVGVIVAGLLSDRLFAGRRTWIGLLFVVGMTLSCALLVTGGAASLVVFAVSLGLIGFFLYGPDALLTGAGAIDVGSQRGATLAAGIINGMGSVGSVVQELALGQVLGHGSVETVFALLFAAAVGSVLMLGWMLQRNRRGLADL